MYNGHQHCRASEHGDLQEKTQLAEPVPPPPCCFHPNCMPQTKRTTQPHFCPVSGISGTTCDGFNVKCPPQAHVLVYLVPSQGVLFWEFGESLGSRPEQQEVVSGEKGLEG